MLKGVGNHRAIKVLAIQSPNFMTAILKFKRARKKTALERPIANSTLLRMPKGMYTYAVIDGYYQRH